MRTTPPESWDDQDITDLQVLFNLAWADPSFLEEEPLVTLVEKGSGFDEEDKQTVLAEHLGIVGEVIPLHAEMEGGQIEVTTTRWRIPSCLWWPTSRWRRWATCGPAPRDRFQRGGRRRRAGDPRLDTAERLLGRSPQGMWPGEGSVAQLAMSLFSKNDVQWVATGEDVLAQSVDIGSFTRDADDVVAEADVLYLPMGGDVEPKPAGPHVLPGQPVVRPDRFRVLGYWSGGRRGRLHGTAGGHSRSTRRGGVRQPRPTAGGLGGARR